MKTGGNTATIIRFENVMAFILGTKRANKQMGTIFFRM